MNSHSVGKMSRLGHWLIDRLNRRWETGLDRQMRIFGIVMAINYPLYYFIWLLAHPIVYDSILIRSIGFLLCLPLIFQGIWFNIPRYLLVLYWHIAVCLCVPFFFTFFLLQNHISTIWLMNMMAAIFFVLLLFDLFSAIILLLVGSGIALIVFMHISIQPFFYDPGKLSIGGVIATLFATVVIGGFFAQSRQFIRALRDEQQRKLELVEKLKTLSGSMSHDLRTSLCQISLSAQTIKKLAKREDTPGALAHDLTALSKDITRSIDFTSQLITMQLSNLQKESFDTSQFTLYSLKQIIDDAINQYPLIQADRDMITTHITEDFFIWTEQTLFTILIFNLVKNAIFFIKEAGKGTIQITGIRAKEDEKFNFLYIKDTAKGISSKDAVKIFQRFYSNRTGGTGIGLAYCKAFMKASGGDITCDGVEGEYTCFCLKFPSVN